MTAGRTIASQAHQTRALEAAEWASLNPVLLRGEPGFAVDTDEVAFGDGVTAWNDLPKYRPTRTEQESVYSAANVTTNVDVPSSGITVVSDGVNAGKFEAHVGASSNSTTGGRSRLQILDDDTETILYLADGARASANGADCGPLTVKSPKIVLPAGTHHYKLQNATAGGGQSTLIINGFAPAILRWIPA